MTIYIKVDDLDAKVKLIEENGGFIVDPPLDLPGGSRLCLFNEPSGVTLAMIQAAKKLQHMERHEVNGTPIKEC